MSRPYRLIPRTSKRRVDARAGGHVVHVGPDFWPWRWVSSALSRTPGRRRSQRCAPGRAVGVRTGDGLRPPRRVGALAGRRRVRRGRRLRDEARPSRPRPERLDELRRGPRQRRRRRRQRLRRRRPRRRPDEPRTPTTTSTTASATAPTSSGHDRRGGQRHAASSASRSGRKLMTVKVLDDTRRRHDGRGRRGHPLRRRQRRADHQPQPRDHDRRPARCAPRWRPPRRPTRWSSRPPATAGSTSTASRSSRSRSPPRTSSAWPRRSPTTAARCPTSPTTAA